MVRGGRRKKINLRNAAEEKKIMTRGGRRKKINLHNVAAERIYGRGGRKIIEQIRKSKGTWRQQKVRPERKRAE